MKVKGIPTTLNYIHQALCWPAHPAERTISEMKFKGIKMYIIDQGLLLIDPKGKQCLLPNIPNVANSILPDNFFEVIEYEGAK